MDVKMDDEQAPDATLKRAAGYMDYLDPVERELLDEFYERARNEMKSSQESVDDKPRSPTGEPAPKRVRRSPFGSPEPHSGEPPAPVAQAPPQNTHLSTDDLWKGIVTLDDSNDAPAPAPMQGDAPSAWGVRGDAQMLAPVGADGVYAIEADIQAPEPLYVPPTAFIAPGPTVLAAAESSADVASFGARVLADLSATAGTGMCEFEADGVVPLNRRLKGCARLDYPLNKCPCNCTSRNNKTAAPQYVIANGGFSGFHRTGWLPDGTLLAIKFGRWTPHFGRVVVDAFGYDGVMHTLHIRDAVSASLHCCPIAWIWEVYMSMRASWVVDAGDVLNVEISEHMRSKTAGYRYVFVPELKMNLHQAAWQLRHNVGMHAIRTSRQGSRVQIRWSEIESVQFESREDVRQAYAKFPVPIEDESKVRERMATMRLAAVTAICESYKRMFFLHVVAIPSPVVHSVLMHPPPTCMFSPDVLMRTVASHVASTTPMLPAPGGRTLAIGNGESAPGPAQAAELDNEEDDDIYEDYGGNYPTVSIPDASFVCPASCATHGSHPEVEYMDNGWLAQDELVVMELPNLPGAPGLVYLTQESDNSPRRVSRVFDLTMGRHFCCFRAWAFGLYLYHYSVGTITDTRHQLSHIAELLSYKTYVDNLVRVVRHDITIGNMAVAHRVAIVRNNVARRARGPAAVADAAPQVLTLPELLAAYAMPDPAPSTDAKAWERLLADRITAVLADIARYRTAISIVTDTMTPPAVGALLAKLPVHEMPASGDALERAAADARRTFFPSPMHY